MVRKSKRELERKLEDLRLPEDARGGEFQLSHPEWFHRQVDTAREHHPDRVDELLEQIENQETGGDESPHELTMPEKRLLELVFEGRPQT